MNNEVQVGTLIFGIVIGIVVSLMISAKVVPDMRDFAYTKGVIDSRDSTINYRIEITPTTIDTIYIYKR